MFRNYFKTAWRNLKSNKVFSLINILGLALGLICSLFIFLWVKNERGMDRFADSEPMLFSVYERQFTGGEIKGQYNTPGIMADEMKKILPQVEYASGFMGADREVVNTFQYGDQILKEKGGYAGVDFFNMFPYKLLKGSRRSALQTSVDIAISKAMAERFFGTPQAALGKTIRCDNKEDFRVSAVFEKPASASVEFDYLINWQTFLEENKNMQSWDNTGVRTYLLLKPNTDPAGFGKQITHFLNKYATFSGDYHVELGVQPFSEMYLHGEFNSQGYPENGRMAYVSLFSIVAFLILLIACINFMNLTTARSLKRAREIGVRKTMGAIRISLIWQFMGEALLLAFISMLVALIAVILLMPGFNALTGKQMSLPFSDVGFWINLLGITLATGILSGSYPAVFLSSFKPVEVLKGTLKMGHGGIKLRKALVVSQFTLSIVLIIGTWVVTRQVHYIEAKNLGYSREQLLYVPQDGALGPKYALFKQKLSKMAGIKSVSRISYQEPSNMNSTTWGISWEGLSPDFKPTFYDAGVGYDFCKVMGIDVLEGHDFSPNVYTDSVGYILNQAAVRMTGYEDPIGKPFTLWGRKATIVGVVKDFNFNSLHTAVRPLVMYMEDNGYNGTILVKTVPGQVKEALASLEKEWKALNPAFPFTYQFADAAFNKLYFSERMTGKLSNYFALWAILISCLGLLGLALFTAEQRVKEIGIRKVLGASVASIFGLITKQFVVLILVSMLIATPAAWWAMSKWLQRYAYHVTLDWWIFPSAGLLTLLIALATVSIQAVKSAMASPAISLRTD